MSEYTDTDSLDDATTRQPDRERHPRAVKVTYLVIGLLFVGIAGIWLLGVTDTVTSDQAALWAPGLLIAAGVAGLVASLANSRMRNRPTRTQAGPISEEENR